MSKWFFGMEGYCSDQSLTIQIIIYRGENDITAASKVMINLKTGHVFRINFYNNFPLAAKLLANEILERDA